MVYYQVDFHQVGQPENDITFPTASFVLMSYENSENKERSH